MKAISIRRFVAVAAASALTFTGLAAVAVAPAGAAAKSTVTILSVGNITSLNSGTKSGNTAYNGQAGALTSMGFWYYNNDAKLVMNTKFGTMKIVKKAAKDFQIKYTVTKGQVWSDGTPIDAVDLLLSHVVQSDKYSISAKLGDPKSGKQAFESVGYGSAYGEHVVGNPVLSADKYSLTVKFDQPLPDWELQAPGPSPVHALQLLADGKKGLQSKAVNAAAKAKFLKTFSTKNSANLKKIAKVWNEGYNLTNINSSTNPLLLISNGGFIVKSAVFGESMTFVRNPKYSSGPKMATKNPIKTVVIKIINNNTAAVQALRNGDIDVYYNSNGTAADKTALSSMANVAVQSKVGGVYSFIHLRVDTAFENTDDYKGPFAGNSQKARDLRKAFLLATPRQQILDTVVKPVNPSAQTMDTQFALSGTPEHNAIAKASGVISLYKTGTQAERTAKALALVQKYYPNASATNSEVTVRLIHANTPIRNANAALIRAEAKKAGFDVVDTALDDIFENGDNSSAKYDVATYAFGLNSISQSNGSEIFKSDGGNNVWGWNNSALDTILKSLQGDILTPKQLTAKRIAADKIIIAQAWGLPLYQNPSIAAYNKSLKGIKPAPVGNNIVWNFFEWHY